MGGIRRSVTAFAVLAITAATMTAAPTSAASEPELPTVREAVERLVARGVARADIVVQTGERNYAGPACPGEGWLCTEATTVVQHSRTAAANVADCSPGGTTGAGSCEIVQVSAGGDNTASCQITDDENISLVTCSIDQSNTSGANQAHASQTVAQTAEGVEVTQDAELQTQITQANGSGFNGAVVGQTADQSLSLTGPFIAHHLQDARMCASVHQTSTTGDNSSDIDQFHIANSDVINVIEVEQRQQSAPVTAQPCADGGLAGSGQLPNLHVVATQFSDSGAIVQSVQQQQSLTQNAISVAGLPASQLQGPDVAFTGGGLGVELDGDTTNPVSTYTSSSEKDWTQDATTLLEVSQVQNDREVLSGIGLGFGARSYRDCTWLLDTNLQASQTLALLAAAPSQTSSQKATTHCTNSNNGTISSNLNGDQQSQTFTDEFVSIEVNRGPGAPASGHQAFPRLHKAVVNDSQEGSFGGPESPSSTTALPGDQIRFRLTAVNSGHPDTTVTGGVITDVLGEHMTFDDAASSPACAASGDGGPGDTVTCSVPDIPGGASTAIDIVVDLDADGQAYDGEEIIPNTATYTNDNEAPQPSNTVHVRVLEPAIEPELHKAVILEGSEDSFTGPETPSSVSAYPGDLLRFRLTAHNHGHPSGTGTSVVITDTIPEHMSFHGCTGPCSVSGTGGPGDVVSFSRPNVPGGGSLSVELVLALDPSAESYGILPKQVPNVGAVSMSGSGPIASNAATVTVLQPLPFSDIDKAVRWRSCPEGCFTGDYGTDEPGEAGEQAEYRLIYTNTGAGPAHNVVLSDAVPPQMTLAACLGALPCKDAVGGAPVAPGAPTGSALVWELGTVPAGGTVEVEFRVDIDPWFDEGWSCDENSIDNTASGSTGQEGSFGSNFATITVFISCEY